MVVRVGRTVQHVHRSGTQDNLNDKPANATWIVMRIILWDSLGCSLRSLGVLDRGNASEFTSRLCFLSIIGIIHWQLTPDVCALNKGRSDFLLAIT